MVIWPPGFTPSRTLNAYPRYKKKSLTPALGQTLDLIILIMITSNCVISAQVALSSNQLWLAKRNPQSISSG
jgi:hypothetical protein